MAIKCIIVDDEPLAIEVLEAYVDKVDSLELVGKFRNAIRAFDFIQSHDVDLMFLDIQMPKLTGIELLKTLKNPPKVIFTTAYREYALEGYELEVVDYLLKPISFERFMKSASRVLGTLPSNLPTSSGGMDNSSDEQFIFFKADKKMIKVFLNDILYIESLKDYVRITTGEKEVTTHQKISYLENKLPHEGFLRVHRSFIVAICKIDSYSATEIEINRSSIPIGRNYKNEVLAKLGSIVL